jgi:hypothetical protein
MPSKVTCFWLEPTLDAQVLYRRYVSSAGRSEECGVARVPYEGHAPAVWGYHTAQVAIERRPRGADDAGHPPTDAEKADPRWPTHCDCGYAFAPEDNWQVNVHTLYSSPQKNLLLCTLHDAPAGAMWDAPWFHGHGGGHPRNPDGLYLVVRTPAGDWLVDGPATNGPGWTRTGTPPLVTANPSIGFGNPMHMHGWLRNGVLEIDTP